MNARERAHKIIDSLPDDKVANILEYLEFIKTKEELKLTNKIISDERINYDTILTAIQQGVQAIIEAGLEEALEDIGDMDEDIEDIMEDLEDFY